MPSCALIKSHIVKELVLSGFIVSTTVILTCETFIEVGKRTFSRIQNVDIT